MATKYESPPSQVGIQVLRGMAALLVLAHHVIEEARYSPSLPSPDWLTVFGAAGVDIFFVISGFIMLYVCFPKGECVESPADFICKRFIRIMPMYWLCISAILLLWSIGLFKALQPNPLMVTSAYILLPVDRPILFVAWTLSFELYFYLIFSQTLRWRSPTISLVATTSLIIVGLLISPLFQSEHFQKFLGNPIVLEFCFGMCLAWLHLNKLIPKMLTDHGYIPAIIAGLAASILIPLESTGGLPNAIRWCAWGLPALLLTASFLDQKHTTWPKWAVTIGDASYAIYLFHPFMMITLATALRYFEGSAFVSASLAAIAFLGSVGLGVAAHLSIEKPLTSFLRTRLNPRAVSAAKQNRSNSRALSEPAESK